MILFLIFRQTGYLAFWPNTKPNFCTKFIYHNIAFERKRFKKALQVWVLLNPGTWKLNIICIILHGKHAIIYIWIKYVDFILFSNIKLHFNKVSDHRSNCIGFLLCVPIHQLLVQCTHLQYAIWKVLKSFI